MASRLRIESHSATPSPTLILDTPADFQLIVFPLGVKVRFAYPFNSEQYGRVRIEETKRRRARQDRPRLRSRLQDCRGRQRSSRNGEARARCARDACRPELAEIVAERGKLIAIGRAFECLTWG